MDSGKERRDFGGTDLTAIVNSQEFQDRLARMSPDARIALKRDLKDAILAINSLTRELALDGLASKEEIFSMFCEERQFYSTDKGSFAALRFFREGKYLQLPSEVEGLPKAVRVTIEKVDRHIKLYGQESIVHLCDYDVYRYTRYPLLLYKGGQLQERLYINTIAELEALQRRLSEYSDSSEVIHDTVWDKKDLRVQVLSRVSLALAQWNAISEKPQSESQ